MQTTSTITIPNVQLTLDDLIGVVRQLDSESRTKVAQALIADDMDAKFTQLIQALSEKEPITDISDEEINAEIKAVRRQHH
jgi:hypothetical protein